MTDDVLYWVLLVLFGAGTAVSTAGFILWRRRRPHEPDHCHHDLNVVRHELSSAYRQLDELRKDYRKCGQRNDLLRGENRTLIEKNLRLEDEVRSLEDELHGRAPRKERA